MFNFTLCLCVCFWFLRANLFLPHSQLHFPEGTKFVIYFLLRYIVSPVKIALTCITFLPAVFYMIFQLTCTSVNEVVELWKKGKKESPRKNILLSIYLKSAHNAYSKRWAAFHEQQVRWNVCTKCTSAVGLLPTPWGY